MLLLRFSRPTGEKVRPLAFGTVHVFNDAGQEVGFGRYHPDPSPGGVAVPLVGEGPFSGTIEFRSRDYNRRWLRVGIPSPVWPIVAEVWFPSGVVVPTYQPAGFDLGGSVAGVAPSGALIAPSLTANG